VGNKGFYTQGK